MEPVEAGPGRFDCAAHDGAYLAGEPVTLEHSGKEIEAAAVVGLPG